MQFYIHDVMTSFAQLCSCRHADSCCTLCKRLIMIVLMIHECLVHQMEKYLSINKIIIVVITYKSQPDLFQLILQISYDQYVCTSPWQVPTAPVDKKIIYG